MARNRVPIRVGVVGLGRAGWDIHVAALRSPAHRRAFTITGCADPLPARRDEAAAAVGCPTFPNLPAMLRARVADLVVVATRSADHARDTIAALRAGCHVVCEKPMATSPAEADRMIAAARRARRRLFIHQNYRFNDEYRHLREVIDSGALGRVFHVRGFWVGYARRNDWQTLRKNGGGVLNNTGPHAVDMALQLLDAPCADVWGDLQHVKDAGNVEDHAKVLLRGANGRTVDLEISTAEAAPAAKWTVLGSAGALTTDGATSTIRRYDSRRVRAIRARDDAAPGRKYGLDGRGEKLPWTERTVPTRPARRGGDFYDNVEAVLRRGARMVVTPESAREIIRVIALARKGTRFPG